jgi:hypothetical protein
LSSPTPPRRPRGKAPIRASKWCTTRRSTRFTSRPPTASHPISPPPDPAPQGTAAARLRQQIRLLARGSPVTGGGNSVRRARPRPPRRAEPIRYSATEAGLPHLAGIQPSRPDEVVGVPVTQFFSPRTASRRTSRPPLTAHRRPAEGSRAVAERPDRTQGALLLSGQTARLKLPDHGRPEVRHHAHPRVDPLT